MKKANKKALLEVESSYLKLKKSAETLDPIKLLSQLTLTYLFVPEDLFVEESSETVERARWIEFLTGFLISKDYPTKTKTNIDGKDLEQIEKLLKEYFLKISVYLMTSMPTNKNKDIGMIIHRAKLYHLFVRGESYPHQLRDVAKDLYSEHNLWFTKKFGFTINEAFSISDSIINEYNKRINNEKQNSLKRAQDYVNELINKGKVKKEDKKKLVTTYGAYYYFGNSDTILSFTIDDLASFSGFSKEKCTSYLNRLSQRFGYKNSYFPKVFDDARKSPWDYNTLYEKPIITNDDKYFVPIPFLFDEVLLNTFYYDLIQDEQYWKTEGEKKYGSWLERKASDYLKRIFPANEVFLNPHYPNGEELCDVLILHDSKVLILQCKTKKLRFESLIGKDIESIKNDLHKGIKESFDQAIRARDYFFNNKYPKVKVSRGEILINAKQITEIFPLSITLGSYQNLTTRFANINPALKLFVGNQYPWSVSLSDLGIITELIESPSVFIHYARRRLGIERTNFQIMCDEIDLLGLYFSQGLYFKTEEFKKINAASFSGFSDSIDRYMFEKYEQGGNPKKPSQKMPKGFNDYINSIESLNSSYKTDCIVRLLDFGYLARKELVDTAEQVKNQTRQKGGLHSFSTTMKNKSLGFSFIAMDSGSDLGKLYRQVFSFATMKKYSMKTKEWVGLGWDKNSKKIIDVALFLSYDWFEDKELDRISKENLKPGILINPKDSKFTK